MTNKYHRQGYRIGGILKLGKKLNKRGIKIKDVNIKDIEGKTKTIKDESKTMDVDTYTNISKASDEEIKKKLRAFGYKDK